MIKKLKIGLLTLAVLSFVFIGIKSVYATSALVFDVDTIVTVNTNNFTIAAGSEATTVAVAPLTLTVVVPADKTFTLVSSSGFSMANDQSTAQTCSAGVGTVAYTDSGSGSTIVFTPTTTRLCGIPSGNRGSYTPPVIPIVPVVPTLGCSAGNLFNTLTGQPCASTVSAPGCSAGNLFNTITGVSCGQNVSTTTTTVTTTTYNFGTTTLKNGSKGEGVKELQRFLNTKLNLGLVVDGMLGPKTIAVIKQWQMNNGLVSDGLVGPKTKAMMNSQ